MPLLLLGMGIVKVTGHLLQSLMHWGHSTSQGHDPTLQGERSEGRPPDIEAVREPVADGTRGRITLISMP